MKADTLTLKALFQKDVRYVIPTFQRPYVWTQEDQWEALWVDLRNVAEWYLEELERAEGNNAVAEEQAKTHFMGAVVLQQRPTASAEIETRTVIDGQQRLTTMQLLLDAAQEVMEELEFPEAPRLARLVTNEHAQGDEIFKLWPASLDQDAFRLAMTNGLLVSEQFEESLIAQAHDFFRLQIREWIESAPDTEGERDRAHGLETALFGLLELVVIDLATTDDPFVIFETLNARGTPLLESDLIKNYVLQTATTRGLDADHLYATEWKPFEEKWWRKEIPTGRLYRPRVDIFLNYWLVMRTKTEVLSSEVFPRFKSYVEEDSRAVESVAADLRSIGAIYRSLEDIDPFTVAGTFLHRWRTIEAGVSTPLLLWLFWQADASQIGAVRFERCLKALESFLVRRMLCRMTAKNYNELFLELLSRLIAAGPSEADDVLVGYLSEQTADSRLWPNDGDFELALLELPLYRLVTRGRLRMVLEALEDEARSPLADESHIQRGALTIEHVLPQKWRDHWPLPKGVADEIEAAARRERALHSLGNLTLVNGHLNPTLSNGSWETKRTLLSEHLVLHLNKDLVNGYAERDWDESTILERGKVLAQRAISIWPKPGGSTKGETLSAGPENAPRADDPPSAIPVAGPSKAGDVQRDGGDQRAAVRDKLAAGATPDQIYAQLGRNHAVWLIAIEEEARREGVLGAEEATPGAVVALRDQRNLRWERVAARVYGDPRRTADVKALYDEGRGPGASKRSYTGRGRRFAEME